VVARATYSTVLSLAQYVNICAVRFGLHSVVRTGGRFERSNSKHRTAFTACLGASNKHLGLGELAVARAGPAAPGCTRSRVHALWAAAPGRVAVGLARGSAL